MKKFILPLLFAMLIVVIGIFFAGYLLRLPVDKNDKTPVIFVVNPNEGVSSIADRLEKEGLIRNRYVFLFEVRRFNLGPKIQAGDFRLTKSATPAQIATELTTGTLDVWIQLIEGWRAEEIAEKLKATLPTYDDSWLPKLKKHEGRLFPDTYLIPKDADINLVVKILTDTFDAKLATLEENTGANDLSLADAIILASIVEREARSYEVRQQVANILLKRLTIGMKLDADATVQYALGFQRNENSWWKKSLTLDDLAVRSPYNTYRNAGSPPGPICNPSLSSLKAVFNASANTPYLYYFHDTAGNSYYAETLEEHNANVNNHR